MKKTLFIIVLILTTYFLIGNVCASKNLIPKDAIRIRVIANSNSEYDQKIKMKVKTLLELNLYSKLKNISKKEDVSIIIKNNLINIEEEIQKLFIKEQYDKTFNINYGYNYFPRKEFKGIVYEEGYYESLVVTVGSGKGDNWWCVLYPPLCMIQVNENDDVEYTTVVKEMLIKYNI